MASGVIIQAPGAWLPAHRQAMRNLGHAAVPTTYPQPKQPLRLRPSLASAAVAAPGPAGSQSHHRSCAAMAVNHLAGSDWLRLHSPRPGKRIAAISVRASAGGRLLLPSLSSSPQPPRLLRSLALAVAARPRGHCSGRGSFSLAAVKGPRARSASASGPPALRALAPAAAAAAPAADAARRLDFQAIAGGPRVDRRRTHRLVGVAWRGVRSWGGAALASGGARSGSRCRCTACVQHCCAPATCIVPWQKGGRSYY